MSKTRDLAALHSLVALKAPLASPSLSGTPIVPTPAVATDNTQVATTAFVRDAITAYAPTPSVAYGAVGTYAWLTKTAIGTGITNGSAHAGSGLRYHGIFYSTLGDVASVNGMATGDTPAGTWRAMGEANSYPGYSSTLFVRIS